MLPLSCFFWSICQYFFLFKFAFASLPLKIFTNSWLSSTATCCWCCLTTAMAARLAIERSTRWRLSSVLGFNRWIQSVPQSPPLAGSIDLGVRSPQPVLPEFSPPSFSYGSSMELMAVPKRKVPSSLLCRFWILLLGISIDRVWWCDVVF